MRFGLGAASSKQCSSSVGGEQCLFVTLADLDEVAALRASWGLFRDRRPELYGALGTLDGAAR